MKKHTAGGIIMSILFGVIAALIVAAISGYFIFRQIILPRYTQKLNDQGRGELAQIVEDNTNLNSLSAWGALLSDKGVMNFLKNLDKNSAKSVIDVLDTLEEDYPAENQAENTATGIETVDGTWRVSDAMPKPTPAPTPAPEPQQPAPAATSAPETTNKTPKTAYERIAAAATAEDMSDGLKIISKLDMGYISSLTAGGLTAEEKKELRAYVKSVLSSAEISRALSLYRAYSQYL